MVSSVVIGLVHLEILGLKAGLPERRGGDAMPPGGWERSQVRGHR